jgi:hypothetical protein
MSIDQGINWEQVGEAWARDETITQEVYMRLVEFAREMHDDPNDGAFSLAERLAFAILGKEGLTRQDATAFWHSIVGDSCLNLNDEATNKFVEGALKTSD